MPAAAEAPAEVEPEPAPQVQHCPRASALSPHSARVHRPLHLAPAPDRAGSPLGEPGARPSREPPGRGTRRGVAQTCQWSPCVRPPLLGLRAWPHGAAWGAMPPLSHAEPLAHASPRGTRARRGRVRGDPGCRSLARPARRPQVQRPGPRRQPRVRRRCPRRRRLSTRHLRAAARSSDPARPRPSSPRDSAAQLQVAVCSSPLYDVSRHRWAIAPGAGRRRSSA